MVKPSESTKTLEMVGNDLFFLVEHFRLHDTVPAASSYQLMVRVLREQCVVEHDAVTGNKLIIIKANKEIASDSLQNPSDPDAGYDGHKGKGYQAQIGETYDKSENENTPQLSLITYVEVEPANASDANALIPYIEATQERDIAPEEILADSLYGSDSNYEQAGKEGIELVAPTMGKPRDTTCSLSDCEFSEDGVIAACPQGHKPVKVKQKEGKCSAAFPLARCSNCPLFAHCPAKAGKNDHCYIRYGQKAARLARRRAYERTEAFKERYRFRAGIDPNLIGGRDSSTFGCEA